MARKVQLEVVRDQGDERVPHEGWPETCRACAIAHRKACLKVVSAAPEPP